MAEAPETAQDAQQTPPQHIVTTLSPASQARILKLAAMGESIASISKELGHATGTISKILLLSGFHSLVEHGKARTFRMIDKACDTTEKAISKGSVPASLAVLKGTGVLQEKPDVQVNVNVNSAPQELAGEYTTLTVKPVESSE